jgi:hypothetical protein
LICFTINPDLLIGPLAGSLMKKGRDLAPTMLEIIIWSSAHDDRSFAMRGVLEKINKDCIGFETSLRTE